jgi:hypothetical protein
MIGFLFTLGVDLPLITLSQLQTMKNIFSYLTLVTLAFASGCASQTETETTTSKCEKSAPKTAVVAATTQTDADILKRDAVLLERGSYWNLLGDSQKFLHLFPTKETPKESVALYFVGNQILIYASDRSVVVFDGTFTLRTEKGVREIVIRDNHGKKPDFVGIYGITTNADILSLSFPSLAKPDSELPEAFLFFR